GAPCCFDSERDCDPRRMVPLAPTKADRQSSADTWDAQAAGGNWQYAAAVTCSRASARRGAQRKSVGTCSGEGAGGNAQRKLIANACDSPDRGTTDTRNGVNPRGHIRYGERG